MAKKFVDVSGEATGSNYPSDSRQLQRACGMKETSTAREENSKGARRTFSEQQARQNNERQNGSEIETNTGGIRNEIHIHKYSSP